MTNASTNLSLSVFSVPVDNVSGFWCINLTVKYFIAFFQVGAFPPSKLLYMWFLIFIYILYSSFKISEANSFEAVFFYFVRVSIPFRRFWAVYIYVL